MTETKQKCCSCHTLSRKRLQTAQTVRRSAEGLFQNRREGFHSRDIPQNTAPPENGAPVNNVPLKSIPRQPQSRVKWPPGTRCRLKHPSPKFFIFLWLPQAATFLLKVLT